MIYFAKIKKNASLHIFMYQKVYFCKKIINKNTISKKMYQTKIEPIQRKILIHHSSFIIQN